MVHRTIKVWSTSGEFKVTISCVEILDYRMVDLFMHDQVPAVTQQGNFGLQILDVPLYRRTQSNLLVRHYCCLITPCSFTLCSSLHFCDRIPVPLLQNGRRTQSR